MSINPQPIVVTVSGLPGSPHKAFFEALANADRYQRLQPTVGTEAEGSTDVLVVGESEFQDLIMRQQLVDFTVQLNRERDQWVYQGILLDDIFAASSAGKIPVIHLTPDGARALKLRAKHANFAVFSVLASIEPDAAAAGLSDEILHDELRFFGADPHAVIYQERHTHLQSYWDWVSEKHLSKETLEQLFAQVESIAHQPDDDLVVG